MQLFLDGIFNGFGSSQICKNTCRVSVASGKLALLSKRVAVVERLILTCPPMKKQTGMPVLSFSHLGSKEGILFVFLGAHKGKGTGCRSSFCCRKYLGNVQFLRVDCKLLRAMAFHLECLIKCLASIWSAMENPCTAQKTPPSSSRTVEYTWDLPKLRKLVSSSKFLMLLEGAGRGQILHPVLRG